MVSRSSNLSCTRGMVHPQIHLINPGCPLPGIALQCRLVALNTIHYFILFLLSTTITPNWSKIFPPHGEPSVVSKVFPLDCLGHTDYTDSRCLPLLSLLKQSTLPALSRTHALSLGLRSLKEGLQKIGSV